MDKKGAELGSTPVRSCRLRCWLGLAGLVEFSHFPETGGVRKRPPEQLEKGRQAMPELLDICSAQVPHGRPPTRVRVLHDVPRCEFTEPGGLSFPAPRPLGSQTLCHRVTNLRQLPRCCHSSGTHRFTVSVARAVGAGARVVSIRVSYRKRSVPHKMRGTEQKRCLLASYEALFSNTASFLSPSGRCGARRSHAYCDNR